MIEIFQELVPDSNFLNSSEKILIILQSLFYSDACDNCPKVVNVDQADDDEDTFGNVCDNNDDSDRDGIPDVNDNCVSDPNADQLDTGTYNF